jgi:hypothetical protein
MESGLVREEADRYALTGPLPPLAIPATLQDSLMARLDRLTTARAVSQLGAVLGREFAYDLIRAIALLDEATLRRGLAQLVDAELLYQRGRPPQAWSRAWPCMTLSSTAPMPSSMGKTPAWGAGSLPR